MVFDKNIRTGQQSVHLRAPFITFEIQRNRFLARALCQVRCAHSPCRSLGIGATSVADRIALGQLRFIFDDGFVLDLVEGDIVPPRRSGRFSPSPKEAIDGELGAIHGAEGGFDFAPFFRGSLKRVRSRTAWLLLDFVCIHERTARPEQS